MSNITYKELFVVGYILLDGLSKFIPFFKDTILIQNLSCVPFFILWFNILILSQLRWGTNDFSSLNNLFFFGVFLCWMTRISHFYTFILVSVSCQLLFGTRQGSYENSGEDGELLQFYVRWRIRVVFRYTVVR